MNTMKEKITILEAMEKHIPIQYSETDGETDDWEDLKTSELDFDLYTYRVKPNSKPKSNPDARFKIGDKLVRIADEGIFNPQVQEYYKGSVRDITPMYSMGFRLPITNKETNK